MEIPVYSLVAYSNSGKTTFLEKLIPELNRRNIRVAVVKHDAHDFELDKEGKDSWRITRAGAAVTAIVSPHRAAVMENRPVAFEAVVDRIENVDLIITEGGKHASWRKILLYREAAGKPMAAEPDECLMVVTDAELSCSVPVIGLDAANLAAELIINDMNKTSQK